MPLNTDGTGACDRCAQAEESTSITLFLIVNDLTDTGQVVTRFYCRRNQCSNAVRDAGTGAAPHPQTDDVGTPSNQAYSDGTLPPPSAPDPAPDPATDTPTPETANAS